MRLIDQLLFTGSAVRGHRLRSGLTVLGIAVGICAVVLLTAVGEGVRQFVIGEFTQFGTNIIAVTPGKTSTFGVSGASISSIRHLTVTDAEALYRIQGIDAVVPVIQGNAAVEHGSRRRRTTIIGVGADMPEVWRMRVRAGQFLPDDPFGSPRAFAVLGTKMRDELFGGRNPLGARIQIGGDRFRVIGVMESKGQMLGFDLDDTVFVPVGKASEMFDREGLMEIDVAYDENLDPDSVAADMERVLYARHGKEDFTVKTQQQMLSVLDSIFQILTIGVAAIGGISLIVGAVGIMTIMTISVTERTPEIGLLRAIGTPRRTIRWIFLTEAALLGAIGGVLGILAAVTIVTGLQLLVAEFPVSLVGHYMLAALGLALLLGAVSGVLPAVRAARLEAVEALRTE